MEVEVREEAENARPDSTSLLVNNTPAYPVADTPVVIVRAEEVLLVVLVLMIWVAAIALFFNRWGKIRMLEPYQPKFQQAHRPSCPLAPLSPPMITPQQRMSFSKYNVNCLTDALYSGLPSPNASRRPRQNSVFVGSSTMAFLNPPRRAKSAIDIQHMVINEPSPTNSLLPIINPLRDRRPSITIERVHCPSRRRPSIAIEKPTLTRYQQFRNRRPSCFADRPAAGKHKHFISFDQSERKTSVAIEKYPSNLTQPTISLEIPPNESQQQKRRSSESESKNIPMTKASRSFEYPTISEKPITERMSTSLDVSVINFERSPSATEEDRASPITIMLEDARLTAPLLLETLKSSDV